MSKQPEALRIADWLEEVPRCGTPEPTPLQHAAAAELRRQHALIAELVEALEVLAKLGNGDYYGNSKGNVIALNALAKAKEAQQ